MNGMDLLILVNTGTEEVPVYEAIGCQRDATIEETSSTIDSSCKDSRAQRVEYGRYSSTISMDAVYVPDDAAYLVLHDAMRNREMLLIAREEFGEVIEIASCVITSISGSFPDQDVATISIGLTVDDFWQEVGS